MADPLISVVMSCYNAAATMDRAISSILNQSFNNFEFIIIDDGSTDTTKEKLKKWTREDQRILIIENERNIGLAASLNKGILRAKGSWIARMDADDESLLTRLEKQIFFLNNNPSVDILGTAIITRTVKGLINGKKVLPQEHSEIIKRVFKKTLVFHPTIIIRKSIFMNVAMYDESLRWAEDADLWYRIYDKAIFNNLEEPLLIYTVKSQLSLRHVILNIGVKVNNLKRRNKTVKYIPFLIRDSVYGLIRMAGF